MSSTNWKKLYGPIVIAAAVATDLFTVPAGLSYVLTKFTLTNVSAGAINATVQITPSGGTIAQVLKVTIPAAPVQGGVREVVEFEGQILGAGDKITVTPDTAAALAPMVSGVAYTA